jgi:hypothetical protein
MRPSLLSWKRVVVVVGVCMMSIGCSYPSVRGDLRTEDGRTGIPCTVELHDQGYKDGRSLGSLNITAGESFEGILHDPTRSPFHPASDEQSVEVRCKGYATFTKRFRRRDGVNLDLGTVLLKKDSAPAPDG